MIDYNNLFRIAREQFWQFRPSEDTFELWAQKHTVVDHVGQALLVRLDIEDTNEIWIIDNGGDTLLLNDELNKALWKRFSDYGKDLAIMEKTLALNNRQEVTPLDAAKYCTPDAMAECMDGVSDELYKVLWKVVSDYEKDFGVKQYEEPIDMYEDLSLAAMWGKFTNDQRAQINDILTKDQNG